MGVNQQEKLRRLPSDLQSAGADFRPAKAEALAKEGGREKRDMFCVYLIRSEAFPEQRYVGLTADLKKRIRTHNAGGSVHTSKYKPWKLISYHAFVDKRRAQEFECYLKSGSGHAFAKKRLW